MAAASIVSSRSETGRADADPRGGSVSTGSACLDVKLPLGINSVPASAALVHRADVLIRRGSKIA